MSGVGTKFPFSSLGKVSIVAACFWYEPKADLSEEKKAASRVRQMQVSFVGYRTCSVT
jgi:hypothetical protein